MSLSLDTQKILSERFQELPANLQQLLTSEHLRSVLNTLVTQHKLSNAQAVILSNEVTMVLLGFSDKDDFTKQLGTALTECSETIRQQIVTAVEAEVFTPFERELSFVNEALATVVEKNTANANQTKNENHVVHTNTNVVSKDYSHSQPQTKSSSDIKDLTPPTPPQQPESEVSKTPLTPIPTKPTTSPTNTPTDSVPAVRTMNSDSVKATEKPSTDEQSPKPNSSSWKTDSPNTAN